MVHAKVLDFEASIKLIRVLKIEASLRIYAVLIDIFGFLILNASQITLNSYLN